MAKHTSVVQSDHSVAQGLGQYYYIQMLFMLVLYGPDPTSTHVNEGLPIDFSGLWIWPYMIYTSQNNNAYHLGPKPMSN